MSITEMSRTIPPRVLAVDFIPLDRAALCLDCETIYPLSAHECPRCGGMQRSTLATWLKSVKGARQS